MPWSLGSSPPLLRTDVCPVLNLVMDSELARAEERSVPQAENLAVQLPLVRSSGLSERGV